MKRVKYFILGAALCACAVSAYAEDFPESPKVSVSQQNGGVTGVVQDDLGGIAGAAVAVKGTTRGVVTDMDGNFTLEVKKGETLVFSYLGYKTQEIVYNGEASLTINLVEDAQQLSEVVVTALGIKRQSRSLGYSTTQVGGDDFTMSRDPNLGNALSGKIAGVSVAGNATGGGSSRVIIRGNASMTGNNMPLYVVDGVPFDNSNNGAAGQWGGMDMGDGLNNINPDDIESIQVLKGAAASALYGYRGGNGAVLITTKSGKKTKDVMIEVNENITFNSIYDMRDFQKVFGQGTEGIRPGDKQAALDSDRSNWGDVLDGGSFVNFLGNTAKYSYVDNFDKFYNTGVTNNTSASFSGADEKVSYRFGATYNKEKSILPNSGNSQIGLNTNTTYDILKNLHFGVTANYIFEKFNGRSNLSDANGNTNAAILWHANSFDIDWMERGTPDSQWGTATPNGAELLSGTSVYFNNPYWLQYRKTNNTRRSRLTGALNLKWDITDWLYLQGAVQRDGYTLEFKQIQPIGAAADPNGYMAEYNKNFYEMNYNFLLGFNKEVDDFSIGATLGGNKLVNTYKTYYPTNGGRPFVVYGLWSVNNLDATDTRATIEYAQYKVNSLYFTADLGWKNQLFLSITGRNDWFSTLAKDNNSYFYPSVTASWVFTDSFREGLPSWFDFGKIRASWASASNGTSAYQNALTYKVRNYKVNGVMVGTVNNSTFPNTNLKPVKISEKEIGLNLAFFANRLNFDMAYYVKNTKDDIAQVSTSSASGFTSRVMNIGELQNHGFEFMVDATPVKSHDLMWNTTVNFAINSSEVKYLGLDGSGSPVERLAINGATSNVCQVGVYNVLGEAYGQIIGYKYKRAADGQLLLKNGLPQREENQEALGSGVYKWTGGWHNTVTYKNLSLAFLLDFKFGAKLFSGSNYSATSNGLHKNTLVGRSEAEPYGDYVFPGIDEDTGSANATAVKASTYWGQVCSQNIAEQFLYSADFIKLRELSLSYEFPKSFLNNTKVLKGVTLALVARNLWTIMKHTDNIDPETSINNTNGQGLELNGYPYTRSIGLNLNVKF